MDYFFYTLFTLFISLFSTAQNYSTPTFYNFGINEGLPSVETYDIIQDSNNYIWIATDRGVSRYNGEVFVTYNSANGLLDNTVFKIYEDHNHRIWFVTYSLKLSYMENGTFKNYEFNEEIQKFTKGRDLPISSFFVDDNNTVYISLMDKGGNLEIDQYGKSKSIKTNLSQSLTIKSIKNKTSLSKNTFQYNVSADKHNLKDTSYYLDSSVINNVDKNVTIKFGNKTTYICEENKILKIDSLGALKVFEFKQSIISIEENFNGDLMVGFFKGGVKVLSKKDLNIVLQSWFTDLSISSILFDNQEGIWLTTLEKGVLYLPNIEILTSFKDESISTLDFDGKGNLLIGTENGLLYSVDIKSNNQNIDTVFRENSDPIINVKYNKFQDNLVIGKASNTYFYKDKNLSLVDSIRHIYSTDIIHFSKSKTYLNHPNQIIIIGRLNEKEFILKPSTIGRSMTLAITPKNQLWVGTTKGAFYIENKTFKQYLDSNHYLNQRIEKIAFYGKKIIFGTREEGLVVCEGEKSVKIRPSDGLIGSQITVLKVIKDELWVGTNSGLSRISFVNGKYEIKNIRKSDGLVSNQINDITINANHVFVATNKGLSTLKYPITQKQVHIPVNISYNLNIGEDLTSDSILKLPYKYPQIEFRFEIIDFHLMENIEYRYKLKGLENSWQYTTNNSVKYRLLTNENYIFFLEIKNHQGIWVPANNPIFIIVKQPFWKKMWFIMSVVLCLVFLISILVKFRLISKLKQLTLNVVKSLLKKMDKRIYIEVKNVKDGIIENVNIDTILWLESDRDYVILTLEDDKIIKFRSTFKKMKLNLDPYKKFVQIHRSYIVNEDKITGNSNVSVKINNKTLPISKNYLHILEKLKK